MDDILLNKYQIAKRCIKRIKEEYDNDPENLRNYTKQDSIILNIQRLSEAAIDIAMHITAELELGLPQSSRDGFEILENNEMIDSKMSQKLKAMVGFRNIAVHEYQKLNLKIVEKIIEEEIDKILQFSEDMLKIMEQRKNYNHEF